MRKQYRELTWDQYFDLGLSMDLKETGNCKTYNDDLVHTGWFIFTSIGLLWLPID